MDPQSWPAEPQDYKQEYTEHAFIGVNSKSAWRAARLPSSCTGMHSRTTDRSGMALTVERNLFVRSPHCCFVTIA
jgi:hypothetical protein